jgi:hypothetical protein
MIKWVDKVLCKKNGARTLIAEATFEEAYEIIRQSAKARKFIPYSQLESELKKKGHKKINRGTIGGIVGEVSDQVSMSTSPSIYPSSIVVHKWTETTGKGFWTLEEGTLPPSSIATDQRKKMLKQYQNSVFERVW